MSCNCKFLHILFSHINFYAFILISIGSQTGSNLGKIFSARDLLAGVAKSENNFSTQDESGCHKIKCVLINRFNFSN